MKLVFRIAVVLTLVVLGLMVAIQPAAAQVSEPQSHTAAGFVLTDISCDSENGILTVTGTYTNDGWIWVDVWVDWWWFGYAEHYVLHQYAGSFTFTFESSAFYDGAYVEVWGNDGYAGYLWTICHYKGSDAAYDLYHLQHGGGGDEVSGFHHDTAEADVAHSRGHTATHD